MVMVVGTFPDLDFNRFGAFCPSRGPDSVPAIQIASSPPCVGLLLYGEQGEARKVK